MSHGLRVRLVLFTLLVASLFFTSLLSLPGSAEAACSYTSCGSWKYNGCCGSYLYQYRQCCNGTGSCCFQYRCTSSRCYF